MANGHSVIPIDSGQLANDSIEWVKVDMVFVAANLPQGRFPTLRELRQIIHDLSYDLEETHDWYVTSEDDFTEIWFRGNNGLEETPIEFWFRRGYIIVLDIMQHIANRCGSFIVVDHSGAVTVVIVPDSVFPAVSQPDDQIGFIATIAGRMSAMIEQLNGASLEDTLFLLSQIRQPLRFLDRLRNYELFQSAQQGLPTYTKLLKHGDARVRYTTFDLIATFQETFFEYGKALSLAIKSEIDSDTKARMIQAIESHIVGSISLSRVGQPIQAVLDILLVLSNDTGEALPVRLAAANMLARAQPGFVTSAIHETFVDALIQPEAYAATWDSAYSVSQQTLKSIQKLLLNHRIKILISSLPRVIFAQDAHDVLRELLDNVFFGEVRKTWMSSLPDDRAAERPERDETRFREHLSRDWLYPANPTKLTIEELLPFQREVLEIVMDLDIPWMVHSNLLEKYGLPATRQAVRDLLTSGN